MKTKWLLPLLMLPLALPARAEGIPQSDIEAMANLGAADVPVERRISPRRDPFAPSPAMLANAGRYTATSLLPGEGFLPTAAAKPPKMRRLGFVNGGKQALALLEIEGVGVFQVRDGDSISLHAIGREDSIKVRHVDQLKIEVQVGTVGSIIVR